MLAAPRRRPTAAEAASPIANVRPQLLIAWLHLAVLWTLAFAKPLFDVLADSPEFFVARGNTGADIVLFAIGMVLIPPTVLVLVEAAFTRVPAVRRTLHLLFVGVLAGAFAIQVLEDLLGASSGLLLTLAALAGAGIAVLYRRTRAAPAVLTVLGPAPLVFLFIFLLFSPVTKLVLPREASAAADASVESKTPIVMVVFDELDPNMLMNARGQIDRTRYPNFAALADRSTWYRNATTVNSQTTMAVPALLSGEDPDRTALPVTADYPNNLFTMLGNGYAFQVQETATELCPERLCGEKAREAFSSRIESLAKDLGVVSLHLLLPDGLSSGLPAVDRAFEDFAGGGRDEPDGAAAAPGQPDVPASALANRTSAFQDLVRGVGRTVGRPGLHFLHAALPHSPWQYLPSGQQYVVEGPDFAGLRDEVWSDDPIPARMGLQRHLLQVGYVDRLLGKLLARLEATGLLDRALVVITADHGVSYRAGQPRRSATPETVSDIAAVPLLIKAPGQRRGRVDDSMVRTLDIVPTIAKRLGTELPWNADGRPLDDGMRPDHRVTVAAGDAPNPVSVSFADFVRKRKAGLRRMIRLFAAADGGEGLYATGPDADLLGRVVPSLSARASGRVEFDSTQPFARLDPNPRVVPSFVTGRIVGAIGPGKRVAVAVNGRIRGVTVSFEDGEDVRMAAMVPPRSFHAGANAIEVFAIDGTGAARRLSRLGGVRPESYRLVKRGDETVILATKRRIPVSDGAVEGFFDHVGRDDQGIVVSGWAVDPDAKRPADRVLAFANGRLITQEEPDQIRPDIARAFESYAAAESGFTLRPSTFRGEVSEVRVFAISGGGASELPRYEG